MIRIHSGTQSPSNAFTAVLYRDYWFWIDDRDLLSKATFSFIMFIFNLVDTGTKEGTPVVTIPRGDGPGFTKDNECGRGHTGSAFFF